MHPVESTSFYFSYWTFTLPMMIRSRIAISLFLSLSLASSARSEETSMPYLNGINPDTVDWSSKTEGWWRSVLPPEQFRICRQGGTEVPFSGKYCHLKEHGEYRCALCGLLLFHSSTKFDSGTGWPSFTEAAKEGAITYHPDHSQGMERTEVRCGRCGAHLGHVFEDGPPPSRKRFCINSACLLHKP